MSEKPVFGQVGLGSSLRRITEQRSEMRRLAYISLAAASFLSLFGSPSLAARCLPDAEFEPTLIKKIENTVTFKCDDASPLDLIRAVGFQTRIPIGIVLGRDLDALSKSKHAYDLNEVDAKAALEKALDGTGYSIKEEDHVMVLVAGDLAPRQRMLLEHRFSDFKTGPDETMVILGAMLTMWLRSVVDPTGGFGASILHSLNDERFTLRVPPSATAEDIANQIVSRGSKGMWLFRVSASSFSGVSEVNVEIEPYQHYTNIPVSRQ